MRTGLSAFPAVLRAAVIGTAAAFVSLVSLAAVPASAAQECFCPITYGYWNDANPCKGETVVIAEATDSATCSTACKELSQSTTDWSRFVERETAKKDYHICPYKVAGIACLPDFELSDPLCNPTKFECACTNMTEGACAGKTALISGVTRDSDCTKQCKETYGGGLSLWKRIPGPDQHTLRCAQRVEGSKCVALYPEDDPDCNPNFAACACAFKDGTLTKQSGLSCKGRFFLKGHKVNQVEGVLAVASGPTTYSYKVEDYEWFNAAKGSDGVQKCKEACTTYLGRAAQETEYSILPISQKDTFCYYQQAGDFCTDTPFNFSYEYKQMQYDRYVTSLDYLELYGEGSDLQFQTPENFQYSVCPAVYCYCRFPQEYSVTECRNKTTSFGVVGNENICKANCEEKGLYFDKVVQNEDDGCNYVDGQVTKTKDTKYDRCAQALNPRSAGCQLQVLEKSARDAFLSQGTSLSLNLPLGTTSPQRVVGRAISQLLGVVGSVALGFFVYGGIQWMTAAGNAEKTKKGRDTLVWAAIGIAAIFSAYAFINFLTAAFGAK